MFGDLTPIMSGLGFVTQAQGIISPSSFSLTGATDPQATIAFGFTAPETGQLTSVSFYFNGNTGTPNDVRASVYTDSAGAPNASGPIASSESSGITTIPSAWNSFAMPNVALQKGTRYHIVIKNYTASSVAALSYFSGGQSAIGGNSLATWGFTKHQSSTGDSGWATATNSVLSGWMTMASGLNFGAPFRLSPTNRPTATLAGNAFTIPANIPVFSCIGVQTKIAKTGTPGDPRITIVGRGSTRSIPIANITTLFNTTSFFFDRPIMLRGGERIRVCLDVTGDSANYIRETDVVVDSAAPSFIPFSMVKTVSTDGGVSWTETPGAFVEMMLLGSAYTEFCPGQVNRRTSTGR